MKQTISFSPSKDLFYNLRIHKEIPGDAIEVTDDAYKAFMVGRNTGQRIVLEAGKLVLADAIISQEQLEQRERVWRDNKLAGVQWIRDRHRDEQELGIATTLTPEQFTELLGYIQLLRDWPQSGLFPCIEQRPQPPAWIADLTS